MTDLTLPALREAVKLMRDDLLATQKALGAERIENARLREAFRVMEQAYNEAEAELAAARAALAGAEAERDAYRAALTKVATVELDALEPADHVREVTKKVGPARGRKGA
jgi:septation ring formation regulator EzrA